MVYEIEKRALLSKTEFEKCKKYIAEHGKYTNSFIFKTFLFRKPEYLRIRITEGKPEAEITKKTGSCKNTTREELNSQIKLSELERYVSQIKEQGFRDCVSIKTKSIVYQFNNVSVQFNEIDFLGRIVEIEALTEDEKEIPALEKKVTETMKLLKLQELESKVYQKMMNEMYEKLMKPVESSFQDISP